ncbi:hypothetical protein ACWF95_39880 [Streptomyces vinaceus]
MSRVEVFRKPASRRISRAATAACAAAAILAVGISFSTPAAADAAPVVGEGGASAEATGGKDLGRVVTQAEITNIMKGLAPLPDIALAKGYPAEDKGVTTAENVRKYISDRDIVNALMYKMGDDFPYPMAENWLPTPTQRQGFDFFQQCYYESASRCAFIGKLKPEGQYPSIVSSMNTYGQGGTTTDVNTTTSLSRTESTAQGFKLGATIGSGVTGGFDYTITRTVADTELHSTTEGRRYTIPDGKAARIEGHADSGRYIGWIVNFNPKSHVMSMIPFEMTIASPSSTSPVSYFLADYTPATANAAPAAR